MDVTEQGIYLYNIIHYDEKRLFQCRLSILALRQQFTLIAISKEEEW